MSDTLLLNADYRPHSLIPWQKAITMLVKGVAQLVEAYDDWSVSAATVSFKVPAVLRLLKYVVYRKEVTFSRANIYNRDKYTCMYCGKRAGAGHPLSVRDLTFDHVVPRSRGGKTSWDNIVTCCESCNLKKDDRTPAEARMPLLENPKKPKRLSQIELVLSTRSVPEAWRDYLYWMQELEHDG